MENCNKKPTPPLFTDEQLAEWRRGPVVFTSVEEDGARINARVYGYRPSKEHIIRERIHALNKHIFDMDMQGGYNCLTMVLHEEVEFLKLLL